MKDIDTCIALNRFGLGTSFRDGKDAGTDPRGWVKAQIRQARRVPARLSGFRTSDDLITDIYIAGLERDSRAKREIVQKLRKEFDAEIDARGQEMISTHTPFAERMVMFWSNHFTVSTANHKIAPAVASFEREAIRPHIFGRFVDMLKAATRHPVMLEYLDNHVSVGLNSAAGQRRVARNGVETTLNENHARELLELHTLGVNGGYDQTDIVELAKALSGWSHGGIAKGNDADTIHGRFDFKDIFHEPGPKTVLGKTYRENGEAEGLAILEDLAASPSTARFLATKLVRHFVADHPPRNAVDQIAAVYMKTGGDLAEVSKALVDLEAVWAEPQPKVKSHYELVLAVHRASSERELASGDLLAPLEALGHVPFSAPSPAGWADTASAWIAPEALMRRVEWLRSFSSAMPSMRFPGKFLDDTIGPIASDETRNWVSRAPSQDVALAAILASPEFQRR